MKNFLKQLGYKLGAVIVLVGCLIFLVGCSSDNETDAREFMTADIDNVTFTSRTGSDYVYARKNISTNPTLVIQGSNSNAVDVLLKVINYTGPGSYSVHFTGDPQGSEGLLLEVNRRYSSNAGAGGTGTVTITSENDTEISGTFQFMALNQNDLSITRTISNGKFLARIQK